MSTRTNIQRFRDDFDSYSHNFISFIVWRHNFIDENLVNDLRVFKLY